MKRKHVQRRGDEHFVCELVFPGQEQQVVETCGICTQKNKVNFSAMQYNLFLSNVGAEMSASVEELGKIG